MVGTKKIVFIFIMFFVLTPLIVMAQDSPETILKIELMLLFQF